MPEFPEYLKWVAPMIGAAFGWFWKMDHDATKTELSKKASQSELKALHDEVSKLKDILVDKTKYIDEALEKKAKAEEVGKQLDLLRDELSAADERAKDAIQEMRRQNDRTIDLITKQIDSTMEKMEKHLTEKLETAIQLMKGSR